MYLQRHHTTSTYFAWCERFVENHPNRRNGASLCAHVRVKLMRALPVSTIQATVAIFLFRAFFVEPKAPHNSFWCTLLGFRFDMCTSAWLSKVCTQLQMRKCVSPRPDVRLFLNIPMAGLIHDLCVSFLGTVIGTISKWKQFSKTVLKLLDGPPHHTDLLLWRYASLRIPIPRAPEPLWLSFSWLSRRLTKT